MFDNTAKLPILIGLAGAWLILASGLAAAQEGWRDFHAGDQVVAHWKSSRKPIEGEIVEIDDEHVLVSTKYGVTMNIPRGDLAKLTAKKAAGGDPAAGDAGGAGDGADESGEALPIEFEYGDGKVFKGFVGSKLDVQVGTRWKKGCVLVGVEGTDLVVERMKMPLHYALAKVVEIVLVGTPAGAEAAGVGEDEAPDIPESDEWPPEVGQRVKVLLEGEKEWLFGPVLSVDEEGESFEIKSQIGETRCQKAGITSWVVMGSSAGYLQLARLIRHYGTEVNPDWAKDFLPTARARDDEELLGKIRVRPSPQFRIKSLPTGDVGAKGPKFERERMLEYFQFQRARYLAIAEREIEYFYGLDLFDDEKEVKKVFRELKREKPGKEVEVDTAFIGTSIAKRLQVMHREVKALANTLASAEELEEAEAELAGHKEMASRFTDSLGYFEMYRKLSFATDEQLDKELDELWRSTNKYVRELMSKATSHLADKVEAYDMPRPTTLVVDLTQVGLEALMKDLGELYGGAKAVPYDDDEWLFNRTLRGIVAGIMPPRSGYGFSVGSGGTDSGYAPVYHLVVYRHAGEEICRLALFRIEPRLHVRLLFHQGRLLLSEAEEWIRR